MLKLPRVVVAATASGQGKTTVAVGVMAALTRAGHQVAPAKVGPDYIDPGYHALATGRVGRNLDPWLCDESLILPLLAHGHVTPEPAALSVIEGVMGLYDGRIGTDGFASTAHIAALTSSPVVLVVDISSSARTVAATVHGLATFDPHVQIAGVVLNKAGSQRHADEVRRSVEARGYRVLGVLPRDAGVSAPSRHLGLVPVAERDDVAHALDLLAEQTERYVDLDGIREIACSAGDIDVLPWTPPTAERLQRPVIAVAGGRAFTFRYAEVEELLRAQGAEPVVFDPARDRSLPSGTSALYLGGGFPEMHAPDLAGNRELKREIREAVLAGMPTVAECAGMLYLAESVDGHDFVGAIPARAAMHPKLTLRYHRAELATDSVLGPAGTSINGHEFHRTKTSPTAGTQAAWQLFSGDADAVEAEGFADGFALDPAGTGRATVHASYLHVHWAGNPALAAAFCDAAEQYAAHAGTALPTAAPSPAATPVRAAAFSPVGSGGRDEWASLDHHGDAELGDGLVDFAVNVRDARPPAWLADRLRMALDDVAPYPSMSAARTAIARRHGLSDDMVLPTNGAAEAFTLIARAVAARKPVIVHPQFTEPEAALRRAGHSPEQVILRPEDGFVLHDATVPDDADLVYVGNPTNPTGAIHPRAVLNALRRPGRTLVVDEAFSDAIPGEPQSMIGPDLNGVIVVRSLTKTWSIAGLRAGYVISDPTTIGLLAGQQPHWSVSSLALVAMQATAEPAAVAESQRDAVAVQQWRDHLVAGLRAMGLGPIPGEAPFVLVEVGLGVRERLREHSIAVRSCSSFPGLGPQWIRIAVREPSVSDQLLEHLASSIAQGAQA